MLAYLSMVIGLFLIALGLVAIYIGVLTYIRLCFATLATRGDLSNERRIVFIHGLTEAGYAYLLPFKPLFYAGLYGCDWSSPIVFWGIIICEDGWHSINTREQ